jgi:hypothetical protein
MFAVDQEPHHHAPIGIFMLCGAPSPFLESNLCFEVSAVLISHHNERRPHMVSRMLPCRRLGFCPVRVSRHNQVALRDHVVNACWILRRNLPLEAVSCPSRDTFLVWWQGLEARETTWHMVRSRYIRVRETSIEDVLSPSSLAIHSFSHWHLHRE